MFSLTTGGKKTSSSYLRCTLLWYSWSNSYCGCSFLASGTVFYSLRYVLCWDLKSFNGWQMKPSQPLISFFLVLLVLSIKQWPLHLCTPFKAISVSVAGFARLKLRISLTCSAEECVETYYYLQKLIRFSAALMYRWSQAASALRCLGSPAPAAHHIQRVRDQLYFAILCAFRLVSCFQWASLLFVTMPWSQKKREVNY